MYGRKSHKERLNGRNSTEHQHRGGRKRKEESGRGSRQKKRAPRKGSVRRLSGAGGRWESFATSMRQREERGNNLFRISGNGSGGGSASPAQRENSFTHGGRRDGNCRRASRLRQKKEKFSTESTTGSCPRRGIRAETDPWAMPGRKKGKTWKGNAA